MSLMKEGVSDKVTGELCCEGSGGYRQVGRRGLDTPGRGDRSARAGMGVMLKASMSLNGPISQGSPPGHSEVEGRQWGVYEDTSVPSLSSI